jgi:hypothetical protein
MTEPRPGDWALHRNNQLDAREVARVEGRYVWIFIGASKAGPYPRENYTFSRKSSTTKEEAWHTDPV